MIHKSEIPKVSLTIKRENLMISNERLHNLQDKDAQLNFSFEKTQAQSIVKALNRRRTMSLKFLNTKASFTT